MENALTREQLQTLNKTDLIDMIMNQTAQLKELNQNLSILIEEVAALRSDKFGRKSEAGLVDEDQLRIFNEVEGLFDPDAEEEDIETVVRAHVRRRKGKLEEDLSNFPVKEVIHELSEEELKAEFPNGFSRLPDEIYKKLEYHPSWHEVLEHHIAVYKDKAGDKIIKADHPAELLDHSIVTPSLAAAIINGKYTNAMPLYRIEQEFARNDVNISRQTMANWMMRLSERYLSLVYDRIKQEIKQSSVIHADETPVMVTKDGREGMHKNYMWVYRTGEMCKAKPAILYEYQRGRSQEYPREFLKGFKGKLVCDGYNVYHNIEADEEFTVCGCWAHARRYFADAVKAAGKDNAKGTLAYAALVQIANMFKIEESLQKLPPSKRKERRKDMIGPLVDSFFDWLKANETNAVPKTKTGKGFTYCLNQETYLREFLKDPQVPMDNNAAERAIRGFCVGKNNWHLIDTVNGAKASAVLYSIIETCKANHLKIYEYLKYLLTEIPQHMDDTSLDFLDDLLPWSDKLPTECRKVIDGK